jgi:metal-sulfur cluster biosynthetic enzyme/alkylhydroperoxidase family enzyme
MNTTERTIPEQSDHHLVMPLSITQIRQLLNTVGDPCSVANGTPLGLVDMGVIGDVTISRDRQIVIPLRLTSPSCYMVGYFIEEIRTKLSTLTDVEQIDVRPDLGLDWTPEMMTENGKERRRNSLALRGLRPRVGLSHREPIALGDHIRLHSRGDAQISGAVNAPAAQRHRSTIPNASGDAALNGDTMESMANLDELTDIDVNVPASAVDARLAALQPSITRAFVDMRDVAWRATDPVMLELCRLRFAQLLGDDDAFGLRTPTAVDAGLDEDKVAALDDWATSTLFNARERAYLAFAEQFNIAVSSMGDDDVARLTEHDSEAEVGRFAMALYVVEMELRLRMVARRVLTMEASE